MCNRTSNGVHCQSAPTAIHGKEKNTWYLDVVIEGMQLSYAIFSLKINILGAVSGVIDCLEEIQNTFLQGI